MPFSTLDAPAAAPAEVLAQLPAKLLHVASAFASKDPYKPSIGCIHVLHQQDLGRIKIEAVNGHIAFRCILPSSQEPGGWWMNCNELFLSAATFAKRPAYSKVALIRADGEARLYGARKGTAMSLQESRPLTGHPCEMASPFPNLDQLWPAEYACMPAGPLAVNASYLRVICDAVARYSEKAIVRFAFNSTISPCHLETLTEDQVLLQFLLMPVQIRDKRPIGVEPSAWPE